jgi:DNA-binding GntR family transcriptional regulator
VVEIEPAIARRDDPSALRLSKGSAYLVLSEVHYGKDAPVAYSRVHVDDRFLRFKIVRHQ